eukprot:519766_1
MPKGLSFRRLPRHIAEKVGRRTTAMKHRRFETQADVLAEWIGALVAIVRPGIKDAPTESDRQPSFAGFRPEGLWIDKFQSIQLGLLCVPKLRAFRVSERQRHQSTDARRGARIGQKFDGFMFGFREIL